MPLVYACGTRATCGKAFNLNRGLESILYKFKHCTRRFASNEGLSTHAHSGCILPAKTSVDIFNRRFMTDQGLAGHKLQLGLSRKLYQCVSCVRSFETQLSLSTHRQACHPSQSTPAPSAPCSRCPLCPLIFNTVKELNEHTQFTHKRFPCELCTRTFTTKQGMDDHIKGSHPSPSKLVKNTPAVTPVIPPCDLCKQSFVTKKALEKHLRSPGKAHFFECTACNMIFKTKVRFDKHNEEDARHSKAVALKKEGTLTCKECKSDFRFYSGLADHILATKHKHDLDSAVVPATTPTRVSSKGHQSIVNRPRAMKCVFCTDMFKSPSGIARHIEAGVHEYHRHHVTVAIKSMGVVPQITIQDYTNSATPPPVPTITTYVATAAAFTGSAYACFLCTATFKTLPALNSHLNSAAHDAVEFKCPNAKCGRAFTLISGLIQHLESRCCGLASLVEIDGHFDTLKEHFSRTMETRPVGPSA